MTAAELDAICQDTFTITAENELAQLDYVSLGKRDDTVFLVLRLIVWERAEAMLRITDVKEQEVVFLPGKLASVSTERLRTFMRALARVLAKVMCHPNVDYLLPHDLVITSPLGLKKAVTEDDFVKALQAKSRLGGLLEGLQAIDAVS